MIRVGTSGWQYDDWKGTFYPGGLPTNRWLPYFAERYRTVEVNNTFYRLPSEDAFRRWREETPAGFLIAVKASRYITHIRRLREPREPVELLWSRCRVLGDRLGPVLLQLPPGFKRDVSLLRDLLAVVPNGMRPALEFRDGSWLDDEVFEALDAKGAAFVLAHTPGTRVPDVVTGGWSYVRFHQGTRRGPDYPAATLTAWARRLTGLKAEDVFVYFNNDTGGAALRDADRLIRALRREGADVD
jgi:uncharacterized protein YecE (DUF72 family)